MTGPGWRILVLPVAVVLLATVLVVSGCSQEATEATSATRAEPAPAPAPSPSSAAEPRSPRAGSYTGFFSTPDGLQLCSATASEVVCVSTVSTQQVRLDASGADYDGLDGSGMVMDADPLRGPVTTPAGITCKATSRGIECSRGGHGFVIGDRRVVILRGSDRTVHDAPTSSADLPPPADVQPVPAPAPAPSSDDAAVITRTLSGCDYFMAEKRTGYVVLEWYGGSLPDEGDTWYGIDDTYGFQDIGSGSSRMKVWTEDYQLSEARAYEVLAEKCS